MNELDFVLALHTRSKELGECRGPLLMLTFEPQQLFTIERIFESDVARLLLWSGLIDDPDGDIWTRTALCAAHWMDLAGLIWMRAQQQQRADFHAEADHLLADVCLEAGWDAKEIVNMFQWRRLC